MDTLKLVYNPAAGDKHFKNSIDDCAAAFQKAGYQVNLLRATSFDLLDNAISVMDESAVVAAGGDGTINLVVNALMRHKKDVPLGIIPAGTANDFAAYLKMPKDYKSAAEAIVSGRVMRADLGLANNKYFINVCGGGMLANVSQQIDTNFKDALGKLAYYLKGLGQLPNFMPVPLRISTPNHTLEDEFFLFLILNGGGAGGFDRLSTTAKIDDGMLDFVGFKAMSMIDIAAIFLKVISGDYLEDRRVVFLRDQKFLIEHIVPAANENIYTRSEIRNVDTDIDGEAGPQMPLNITCEKEIIRLFVPEVYR